MYIYWILSLAHMQRYFKLIWTIRCTCSWGIL